MRLRLAKKISKTLDTPRESAYSAGKHARAQDRIDRSREAKESWAYLCALMRRLGPAGRAKVLAETGRPDLAFDLLMRAPESEWAGDPTAMTRWGM